MNKLWESPNYWDAIFKIDKNILYSNIWLIYLKLCGAACNHCIVWYWPDIYFEKPNIICLPGTPLIEFLRRIHQIRWPDLQKDGICMWSSFSGGGDGGEGILDPGIPIFCTSVNNSARPSHNLFQFSSGVKSVLRVKRQQVLARWWKKPLLNK